MAGRSVATEPLLHHGTIGEFGQIESDWMRSVGQITRRVELIYPAAGQIDTPYLLI